METLVSFMTSHRGGVMHMAFSSDGQKLVTIGMDRAFSIQVWLWKDGKSLCFRNSGMYPIFGFMFADFDDTQLITCGYQHLCFWKLVGSHLSVKKYIQLPKPNDKPNSKNILLCFDFIH